MTSYHEDAASTGQDLSETLLTPSNVNSTDFGRIFDTTLDGQVYAEPLAVNNVNITRGSFQGIHNVMFVATMHDSLFAIDSTTGQILWQDSFLQISNPEVSAVLSPVPTAGVTTVPASSGDNALVNGSDVGPEFGIIATPVINPATNVLYVVANTQEVRSGSTPVSSYASGDDIHYVQRLWAVNLSDGSVAIAPSNPSVEPTSNGEVIGDTILDPTGSNTVPSFSSYTGYKYVTGPYIKGSGNNGGSHPDDDGWIVNTADTSSPWGKLGETAAGDGYIAFNALLQMGRTALSLIDGTIYFGYASHGDDGPYYGWLLGYSASSLSNTTAFLSVPTYESFSTTSGDNSTFNAQAGFWGSGMGITTDGTYLYVSTGNGGFNPNASNFSTNYYTTDGTNVVDLPMDNDYGDAVIKLAIDPSARQNGTPGSTYDPDNYNPNGYGLKVVDFFVPSNEFEMNKNDEDLGSGGVLMIPASGPGYSNPDGDPMLVVAGKEGRIYLLDDGDLGGYNTAYIADGYETTNQDPSSFDHVLGEYYYYEAANPGTDANNQTYKGYDTPSYFNGNIYIGLGGGSTGTKYLPEWEISVASLLAKTSPPGSGVYTTISHSTTNTFGGRGTTSTISADGTASAIVWSMDVTQSSTDDLLAYNASTMATLYDSQTDASRDSLTNGGTVPGTSETGATGDKFGVPTVFDGMVYVGTSGGSGTGGHIEGTLVGYGLLPSYAATASDFVAPSNLTGYFSSSNTVQLSWKSNSPDATQYEIDRSVNGGAYSILAYVAQNGGTTYSYTDSTVTSSDTYKYEVRAISGGTIAGTPTGGATAESATAFSNIASLADAIPVLSSAVSEKPQGSAGTFSISLLSSSLAVEDRIGGPTDVIFAFENPVFLGSNFSLSLTSGTGTATVNGSDVDVNMSGAVNGQTLSITLDDVRDVASGASGDYTVSVGVLLGDVNGDDTVNGSDVAAVKLHSGQTVNGSNFRDDINCNGAINSNDITIAKVNSGQSLAGNSSGTASTSFMSSYLALYQNLLGVSPTASPASVTAAPAKRKPAAVGSNDTLYTQPASAFPGPEIDVDYKLLAADSNLLESGS
ncbi:MAG TPA: dockerin type I domain-containing protein [Tepidisphaeraceae bacterium]|nr:dockerin type I domain-containing protein [Tepidisphaeraceae bacterium]